MSYRVAGAYFESCNCEAICPCRMVGGIPGGRSTYGECFGVLSWVIERGHADDVDLSGLGVALVFRYDDDEPGSPWKFVLHVDGSGTNEQQDALTSIFTGARGGVMERQPWVRKPSTLVAVRAGRIEFDGEGADRRVRVGGEIEVAAGEVVDPERVRCIVPGYDEPGVELRVRTHRVHDDPFEWALEGRCAFSARFDYAAEAPG
jgi:hypothetical protein